MSGSTLFENLPGPIAMEARALSGPAGGVVRYIRGLLRGMRHYEPTLPLVLLCNHRRGLAESDGIPGRVVPPAHESLRLWWDWYALPAAVRRLRPALLHLTKPSGTPFAVGLPAAASRQGGMQAGLPPVVTTIYDVIPLEHPATQTLAQRMYWKIQLPSAATSAAHILTISEFSKRGIVERLGVPPERVTVTYPGVDPAFVPPADSVVARLKQRYALGQSYLLTVGTIEPRKNVDVLLSAFARVAKDVPHTLVIAGRWGWKTESVKKAAKDPRLTGRVRFLGAIPPEDLPPLYGGADAFVFLSRSEGFGFPPLEAMACGTPVVTSGGTSLEEIAGEAALLVNPQSVEQAAQGILRVLSDAVLRADLRSKGLARASAFTWENTVQGTLRVYEQVLKEHPNR